MDNFENGFIVQKKYDKNTHAFQALISNSDLPCDVRGNWLRNSISMLTHHWSDINLILKMIGDLYPEYEFCLYYQMIDKETLEAMMILGFDEVDEKFCISWNSDISKTSIILFKPEDDINEITNITMKLTLCIKHYDLRVKCGDDCDDDDVDDDDDYDDYDMYTEQCDSDLAKLFAENIKKKFIEGVRFSFKFPIYKPNEDEDEDVNNE